MSTKYKFESIHEDDHGSMVRTSKEFDAEALHEVYQEFKEFMLGCGFSPSSVEEYFEGE